MVVTCSVYGCKNVYTKETPRHFFRFPLNNNDVLQLWENAIKRKDFKPTKYSKICSDHFLETDYLVRPGSYVRRLKPDAVPSVFPTHLLENVANERKGGKRLADDAVDDLHQEKIRINLSTTNSLLPEFEFVSIPALTKHASINESPIKTLLPEFEFVSRASQTEDAIHPNPTIVLLPEFEFVSTHSKGASIDSSGISSEVEFVSTATQTDDVSINSDPIKGSSSTTALINPRPTKVEVVSTATQTDKDSSINRNLILLSLRKKIKTLKQKLRRKDKTIGKLKRLVNQIKMKINE